MISNSAINNSATAREFELSPSQHHGQRSTDTVINRNF